MPQNTQEQAWGSLRDMLEGEIPEARREPENGEWASAVTSADVKLAYNEEGEFAPVIVGDINANPEGIATFHGNFKSDAVNSYGEDSVRYTGDVEDAAARAFLSGVPGEDKEVAISHIPEVVDGNAVGWIQADKDALQDAIARQPDVDSIYQSRAGEDITVDGGAQAILYTGDEVDGYVNLNDTDHAGGLTESLGRQVWAFSRGENAPTAVWNQEFPETGKLGLLDSLEDVAGEVGGVYGPGHQEVRTVDDVVDYMESRQDSVVLKTDIFGTHGDNVVALDWDEAREHGDMREYVEDRLSQESERVAEKGNRPDDYTLIDDQGRFTSRAGDHSVGVAEEAIDGEVELDGETYEIFDFNGQPVDFVPLTMYDPEQDSVYVPSVAVRASGMDNLNANRGSDNFELATVEDFAYNDGIAVPDPDGSGGSFLYGADEIRDATGVEMSDEEIYEQVYDAMERAGMAAFGTRNLSAYRAEQGLE